MTCEPAAIVGATLRPPDVLPRVHAGEALGHELMDIVNARVLLPRGDLAGDALPAVLRARGAFVDEVVVYRTVPGDGIPMIVSHMRDSAVDALLFTSGSAVRFVSEAIVAGIGNSGAPSLTRVLAACLGAPTAEAARAAGFTDVIVADDTTQDELIDRVARWFTRSETEDRGVS